MRNHHCHAASAGLHGFDHVQDEGIVALGARWNATAEAAELVSISAFMTPLFQTKRRIGDNDVKVLQAGGTVQQLGVANGVAPLYAVVVFAVQKHIHFGQSPGAANGLLAVQSIFARPRVLADQAAAFHQQRARTTGGIANFITFLRSHQPRHQ